MVMVKNPTYTGPGPGIPTTPVPPQKKTGQPYYPAGITLAADDAAAPAADPAPTDPAPTSPTPTPTPDPAPTEGTT